MKIEKNIPIPDKARKFNEAKEIAKAIKVGDSVLCVSYHEAQRLASQMRMIDKKPTIRTVGDGIRVWCIQNLPEPPKHQ